jgi:hypothetical protein
MNESIKEKLRNYNDGFNLEPIIQYMENIGFEYVDKYLNGYLGIATIYCVYIDIDELKKRFNNRFIAYVILHETAHAKRIERMGLNNVIKMLSNDDFKVYSDHIIEEEVVADRYVCHVFKRLTGYYFPREATQQLNLKPNRDRYIETTKKMFGKITNEETYKQYLKQFVGEL